MDLKNIADKWQERWEKEKLFEVKEDSDKEKYYLLEMFPYPSGSGLHMGHALNYTIGDVYARYKRMRGYNVLHPMGYDSLGLPAENAAIKEGVHPKKYTEDSIKNFIKQQKSLGITYDWSRMFKTSDPSYYRWDQWIFLKMFEKGLAYKKISPVNWCSKCSTVLANEQVNDGRCWRHPDNPVEVKNLNQWFLKITEYAEELDDFSKLKEWPDFIKKLQSNWIGKSEGTEIIFMVQGKEWRVFTTRPDTLFGVTFLVISAQHPSLMEIVTDEQKGEVEQFVKKQHSVSKEDIDQLEKEGVFTGAYAAHPFTGDKIPIYAGNFVLAEYGFGMVMAVPAHDQRDFEFARKYNLPLKAVITPKEKRISAEEMDGAYTKEGILINSHEFDGMKNKDAIDAITKKLEKAGLGRKKINFKLRDWLISRQRYWGTPIPIIICDRCGDIPVNENELPVELPVDVIFGKGNPLESNEEFVNAVCPKCGGDARRETDTMDTFINSSWYYLRYADPHNDKEIFDKEKAGYWNPIDLYIGGKEHACMHLIYVRFYTKFLRDIGYLNFDEPAIKLFNQGMLHAQDGNKMSKSLGNVINPTDIIIKKGPDPLRLFLLSVASPDSDFNWDDKGLDGTCRFLSKLYSYFENVKTGKSSERSQSAINKAIKEVTDGIEDMRYNLAIIKIRELFDKLDKEESKETLEKSLQLLSPFCPHITEELWQRLGNKNLMLNSVWPEADDAKIKDKFDIEDRILSTVKTDINHILKILGIKYPKKITLFISDNWKYLLYDGLRNKLSSAKDLHGIIKEVMNEEIKRHGKDAIKIIQRITKNGIIPSYIGKADEYGLLLKNKEKISSEFKCGVEIVDSEKSREKKARQAMPGKPAILIE